MVKVWDSIQMKSYKVLHLSFKKKENQQSFLEQIEDATIYQTS